MRNVLYARFLLIKRYMPKMIFWMIMPLMAAIGITLLVNRTSDDFKVPAALVIHEESAETEMMIEGFKDSRFIDVMNAWGGSWSVRLAVCALTNGCLYITSRYSYSARSLFV